ncbi:hypothetical protein ACX80P_15970 [Arthrobacter sp. TMS1-12-1]
MNGFSTKHTKLVLQALQNKPRVDHSGEGAAAPELALVGLIGLTVIELLGKALHFPLDSGLNEAGKTAVATRLAAGVQDS